MTGYVDVEKLLTGWISTNLSVRTCSELPATLPTQIVQVVRFGGDRPTIPFDDARVDVDCYGTNRATAHDLAEQVYAGLVFSLPGFYLDGAHVVAVACISAPSWAPYDNTSVRRNTAAYLIRTHNPI